MIRPQHYIEYFFLRLFVFIYDLMPYSMGRWISDRIFRLIGAIAGGKYKKRLRNTLSFSFPQNSGKENDRIISAAFGSVGLLFFEFARFRKIDTSWLDRYLEIEPHTDEILKKACAEKKGILLIAGHFGNWEILNHIFRWIYGKKFHVYATPQSNPLASEWIFRSRELTGMEHVLPSSTGIQAVKALRRGDALGMVSDQNARGNGLFIPFLGQPASIFQGPAVIAMNSKVPAYFVCAIRTGGGRFRLEARPLGTLEVGDGQDPDRAIVEFTLKWVDILEKYVRKYPEQYFWLHNRWKTKPGPDDTVHERIESGLEPGT